MNKRQWEQRHGLKAIFRNGRVYLWSPALVTMGTKSFAYFRPIDNGGWMNCNDLAASTPSEERWLTEVLTAKEVADFTATWRCCYCNSLETTCDFCGTTRSALQYLSLEGSFPTPTPDIIHKRADFMREFDT